MPENQVGSRQQISRTLVLVWSERGKTARVSHSMGLSALILEAGVLWYQVNRYKLAYKV